MRFLRVFAAVTLGIFAAGLILEAGLRVAAVVDGGFRDRMRQVTSPTSGIVLNQWASHPFLPFIGLPLADYTTAGENGSIVHVRNNEQGFRTHEFPAVKGPDDRIVVCLGESTTWGAGAASNAYTWPEILEAELAARYPALNVKVFNLGVPAGTSAYSLVAFALIGIRLHPDIVIVYHGVNESGAMMAADFRFDQSSHFYDFNPDSAWRGVRRSLPRWTLPSYAVAYVASLIDDSLRVNSMGFHIVKQNPGVDELPDAGVETTLENFLTLAAIARGEGADTLFSTFQFYDGNDPLWVRFNTILRDFFQKQGLWWVDQDALIADYERSINWDDVHLTRKGNEALADNFAAAIVERGVLEKPPTSSKPVATGF